MPTLELSKEEFKIVMDAMAAYLLVSKSILQAKPSVLGGLKDKIEEAMDDAESE